MNRYHGRVVAITGAAQGLGLAMATRFAAEGATVALADVNEQALTGAIGRSPPLTTRNSAPTWWT